MKQILIVSLTSICLVFFSGCGNEAEAKLCEQCGVEKETDGCCDPDAERCKACPKIKDSDGCCK